MIEVGLEDVFEQLFRLRTLEAAAGVQLDGIGSIVGVARDGLEDPAYRVRIGAQVRINLSTGTPEELLQIARALLPGGIDFHIDELYPAAFELVVDDVFTGVESELARAICLAKPAGVRCFVRTNIANPFEFFGGVDGSGFGDTGDPLVGGNFSSVTGV